MLLERVTEQLLLGPKRSSSSEMCGWLSPAHPRRCGLLASQPTKYTSVPPGARVIDKAPSCSEPSKEKQKKKKNGHLVFSTSNMRLGRQFAFGRLRVSPSNALITSKRSSHQQTRSRNAPSHDTPIILLGMKIEFVRILPSGISTGVGYFVVSENIAFAIASKFAFTMHGYLICHMAIIIIYHSIKTLSAAQVWWGNGHLDT